MLSHTLSEFFGIILSLFFGWIYFRKKSNFFIFIIISAILTWTNPLNLLNLSRSERTRTVLDNKMAPAYFVGDRIRYNIIKTEADRSLKHGDIILFEGNEKSPESYLGRVLGVPGDQIEFRGLNYFLRAPGRLPVDVALKELPISACRVNLLSDMDLALGGKLDCFEESLYQINYKVLQRKGLPLLSYLEIDRLGGETVRVSANHYFVLCDNRISHCKDSRFFGPIPDKWILGRVITE
ncbi:MAG: S26 family signal peptidase [Bdellovibrionota bacterium]